MATWTVHSFRLIANGPRAVYVGVSYYSPAERLRQHLQGHRSSRQVRRGRPELAPELYDHLSPFDARYEAEDAADELADELMAAGYDVRCDPNRLERIAAPAAGWPSFQRHAA
jgi:hypothetical protein